MRAHRKEKKAMNPNTVINVKVANAAQICNVKQARESMQGWANIARGWNRMGKTLERNRCITRAKTMQTRAIEAEE